MPTIKLFIEEDRYYEGSYFVEGDLVKHDYLNDELIYRVPILTILRRYFHLLL